MPASLFIAADWGTTNLRLYLCEFDTLGSASLLESRTGPGVTAIVESCEATFFDLAGDWLDKHGPLPVVVSGMAGSTIGWREAPYAACPVSAGDIAAGGIRFEARDLAIHIVGGLSTQNPLGLADVMRGEELQLLGLMQSAGAEQSAMLVALPGTHNKWALLQDGRIDTFMTAMTGELYSMLHHHSVLLGSAEPGDFDKDGFAEGLRVSAGTPRPVLIHTLFSTRSRQLLENMPPQVASSYLSGLLIGADVVGALDIFRTRCASIDEIAIVGAAAIGERYTRAIERQDLRATSHDAEQLAIAGYAAVFSSNFAGLTK